MKKLTIELNFSGYQKLSLRDDFGHVVRLICDKLFTTKKLKNQFMKYLRRQEKTDAKTNPSRCRTSIQLLSFYALCDMAQDGKIPHEVTIDEE